MTSSLILCKKKKKKIFISNALYILTLHFFLMPVFFFLSDVLFSLSLKLDSYCWYKYHDGCRMTADIYCYKICPEMVTSLNAYGLIIVPQQVVAGLLSPFCRRGNWRLENSHDGIAPFCLCSRTSRCSPHVSSYSFQCAFMFCSLHKFHGLGFCEYK